MKKYSRYLVDGTVAVVCVGLETPHLYDLYEKKQTKRRAAKDAAEQQQLTSQDSVNQAQLQLQQQFQAQQQGAVYQPHPQGQFYNPPPNGLPQGHGDPSQQPQGQQLSQSMQGYPTPPVAQGTPSASASQASYFPLPPSAQTPTAQPWFPPPPEHQGTHAPPTPLSPPLPTAAEQQQQYNQTYYPQPVAGPSEFLSQQDAAATPPPIPIHSRPAVASQYDVAPVIVGCTTPLPAGQHLPYFPPPPSVAPASSASSVVPTQPASETPTLGFPPSLATPSSATSVSPAPPQQLYFPPPPSPCPQSAPGQSQPVQGHGFETAYVQNHVPLYHPAAQGFVTQSSIAGVATSMSNLSVEPHHQDASQTFAVNQNESPREPPAIRASGPPNDIIAECPDERVVEYSLPWHRLPDMPDVLICTRCFADHIANTALSSLFERIQQPQGSKSSCTFWLPRVKDHLWPEAVRTNDLAALRAHMAKRQHITACSGPVPTASVTWYCLAQRGLLDNFLACEACYEDHIAGTSFKSQFSIFTQLKKTDRPTCDVHVRYISSALQQKAKHNDWQGFVAAASHRLRLPPCGMSANSAPIKWFTPRQRLKTARVCEACYLDRFALKQFEHEFEQCAASSSGIGGFLKELVQISTCCMSMTSLKVASEMALYQRNFGVFWAAAEVATRVPVCSPSGITGGNWWTLTGGCDGLNICEGCYAGILKPVNIAQYFAPCRRDSSIPTLCSFNMANPQYMLLLNSFAETVDKGVISDVDECARKWAGVTPCPRNDPRSNSYWWGYNDVLACGHCYHGFMAETPLAGYLTMKEEFSDCVQLCQMWSPRMRQLWLQTCAAGTPGSPESDAMVAKFRAIGAERLQVYQKTVIQIPVLRVMMQQKRMNALQTGMNGTTLSGAGSFAMAAGVTDGYNYGNSSIGWHGNKYSAMGAQMQHNSQAALLASSSEAGQIAQLQAIWAQFE